MAIENTDFQIYSNVFSQNSLSSVISILNAIGQGTQTSQIVGGVGPPYDRDWENTLEYI